MHPEASTRNLPAAWRQTGWNHHRESGKAQSLQACLASCKQACLKSVDLLKRAAGWDPTSNACTKQSAHFRQRNSRCVACNTSIPLHACTTTLHSFSLRARRAGGMRDSDPTFIQFASPDTRTCVAGQRAFGTPTLHSFSLRVRTHGLAWQGRGHSGLRPYIHSVCESGHTDLRGRAEGIRDSDPTFIQFASPDTRTCVAGQRAFGTPTLHSFSLRVRTHGLAWQGRGHSGLRPYIHSVCESGHTDLRGRAEGIRDSDPAFIQFASPDTRTCVAGQRAFGTPTLHSFSLRVRTHGLAWQGRGHSGLRPYIHSVCESGHTDLRGRAEGIRDSDPTFIQFASPDTRTCVAGQRAFGTPTLHSFSLRVRTHGLAWQGRGHSGLRPYIHSVCESGHTDLRGRAEGIRDSDPTFIQFASPDTRTCVAGQGAFGTPTLHSFSLRVWTHGLAWQGRGHSGLRPYIHSVCESGHTDLRGRAEGIRDFDPTFIQFASPDTRTCVAGQRAFGTPTLHSFSLRVRTHGLAWQGRGHSGLRPYIHSVCESGHTDLRGRAEGIRNSDPTFLQFASPDTRTCVAGQRAFGTPTLHSFSLRVRTHGLAWQGRGHSGLRPYIHSVCESGRTDLRGRAEGIRDSDPTFIQFASPDTRTCVAGQRAFGTPTLHSVCESGHTDLRGSAEGIRDSDPTFIQFTSPDTRTCVAGQRAFGTPTLHSFSLRVRTRGLAWQGRGHSGLRPYIHSVCESGHTDLRGRAEGIRDSDPTFIQFASPDTRTCVAGQRAFGTPTLHSFSLRVRTHGLAWQGRGHSGLRPYIHSVCESGHTDLRGRAEGIRELGEICM